VNRSPNPVRRAAIDIGTNSVRLLVADVDPAVSRVAVVDRALAITRLGEGLHANGLLRPDAAARTAAAVEQYIGRARSLGVGSPALVGTYALRAARNPDELLHRLGAPVRVLSGEEEAALGFRGVVQGLGGLDRTAAVIVLDVGGGSVEITWGTPGQGMEGSRSLPVGCVVMTQRFVAHDPPAEEEIAALEGALAGELDPVLVMRRKPPRPRLVGVGGTVTTLAAMAQRLVPYDPNRVHGVAVTAPQIDGLLSEMRAVPLDGRRRLPGLQPERADVIIAGALVVRHVLSSLGDGVITASEADLLWALVAGDDQPGGHARSL
jgi:exopolyphosphatase / guanosine-5'-triphosphate,3'-diphosphate pyrophosphatase